MQRRASGESMVLHADDWSTVWRCRCGYDNAGRERCLMCGGKAPIEARETPGLTAHAHADGIRDEAEPAPKAGGKATKTVVKIILANLLLQGVEFGLFFTQDTTPATAVRISLVTGLIFYALCAAWVSLRSVDLGIRARWGRATARLGATEGFVVGGVIAVFLAAGLRLLLGRPVLDPTASLLASGSVLSLVLGIMLIVVAAPIVEELVFRGFLTEAFRSRGKWAAVIGSAMAFSLAHLNLAQFRYYVAMGVMLGLIYWRRGLIASIAAHATFNGMLVLFAVAAAHGPVLDVDFASSHVSIPGTYRTTTSVAGDDLVATGPGGARIEFVHMDVPTAPSAAELAVVLAHGGMPLPELVSVDTSSAAVIDLPAGEAASVLVTVQNRAGRIVMVPAPGRVWIATFRSDGSFRSTQEFDAALHSWRLPPPV